MMLVFWLHLAAYQVLCL